MTTLPRRGRLLRVPIKLSLALTAGGFVIFGVYGVYELRTARNGLQAVIEQETRLVGPSLQVAVENAFRDRQLADLEKMTKGFGQIDPLVDILVYESGGRLITSARGGQPVDPMQESVLQTAVRSQEEVY